MLHHIQLGSALLDGSKDLFSRCGFKPLGFRVAAFILTLIYSDPPLAGGTQRVADWCHGDVQAPKGRGKGFTYGQHEADKRKREGNTYTRVTELVLLKTAKTKTRVMILEVREGAAVLEFQIPPGLEGQEPRWVAQVPWPMGVRVLELGHFVHTALSRCSLSMMAFSLCILVQSRLSAVRPLPCLAFGL